MPIAPPQMQIPAEVIAEYVSLRSRLASLERLYPGLVQHFRRRMRLVEPSDNQKLLELQAVTSGSYAMKARVREAIARVADRLSEEEAVMLLAQKYWELGDIEEALKELG